MFGYFGICSISRLWKLRAYYLNLGCGFRYVCVCVCVYLCVCVTKLGMSIISFVFVCVCVTNHVYYFMPVIPVIGGVIIPHPALSLFDYDSICKHNSSLSIHTQTSVRALSLLLSFSLSLSRSRKIERESARACVRASERASERVFQL